MQRGIIMRTFLITLLLGSCLAWTAVAQASEIPFFDGQEEAAASKVSKPSEKMVKEPSENTIKADQIIATALNYKGVPYKYGGTSPKGFDCSGFTLYVFNKHGVKLPRTADKQFETGRLVKEKELQAGDIVFFTTTEAGASHCGIYIGKGQFIHASSSRGVMVSSLADYYWKPRYLGARRII
jgi:cell wall-associated NlpC family hydrolase